MNKIENIVLDIFDKDPFLPKDSFISQLDKAFEKEFGKKRHNKNKETATTDEPEKMTLFKFIEQFINEREKDPRFADMTVKNYKISFNYLKRYCEDKKQTIDFEDITPDFAAFYIPFLFDNGLQQNTVHKYIRDLKTFMNNAFERGFSTNLQHKFKAFSVVQKDTVQVYLSQDDLERLDKFDFSDNPILANARDWLMVACSTALRFEDFIQLTHEHIKTKKLPLKDEFYRVIDFETTKTDKPVSIPMTVFLDNCLERNGGTFPPLPTPSVKSANVLLNKRVKKVGKLVGLDESVTITQTFFGKTTHIQKKKYELLKTHTGRRTVISNMLLAGFDPFKVTKISGHKTLKMLGKYDRVTNEENAANLSQDPYFKPK